MMWRHGDVLIARVEGMPGPGKQRSGAVLVHGEKTGHSHRLEDPDAGQLWVSRGRTFLEVTAEQARVVHQEHAPSFSPAAPTTSGSSASTRPTPSSPCRTEGRRLTIEGDRTAG